MEKQNNAWKLCKDEMSETTNEKTNMNWLRKDELKVQTEAMLCGGQEQAIHTNYVKQKIGKTTQSSLLECVTRKIKQYLILWANVKYWHKRSTRKSKVIPVIIGALDNAPKKPEICTEKLEVVISTALLQKTALIGTARILRNVLDCG